MKRLLLIALLIPQLAFSQYLSRSFQPSKSNNIEKTYVGMTLNVDTTIALSRTSAISGFVVTGQVTLKNDIDSYVRITLKDSYNYEFLVYENYPMLSGELSSSFSDMAMETIMLDNITPQSLKVEVHNAELQFDSYGYISTPAASRRQDGSPDRIQEEQTQYLVDRLNSNLERHNKTWRAGITSMSLRSYEEKKAMFGGSVPELFGFEHYKGGVFVMPSSENNIQNRTTSQYVNEWDWRNRHGKNWMTEVKYQGGCGSCWAFAAVGVLEAYINLYYNRLINYDLSEQELVSCSTAGDCSGGHPRAAFNYIRDNGIVLESWYHYIGSNSDCNMNDNPTEVVSFETVSRTNKTEDSIKKRLLVSPIVLNLRKWTHSVVLAGYKTIVPYDVVYNGGGNVNSTIIISPYSHSDLIGKNAWLIKNSWGTDWGTSGYGYIVTTSADLGLPDLIKNRVTSLVFNDSNILCDDADGDGYYFWGIGMKPSNCPNWIPDIPDGNDENANKGALDTFGFLENLNPDTIPMLVITNNVEYNTRQSLKSHIRIKRNGTLIIKDILNLFGHVTIIIESGGKLKIDGGTITNACIEMNTGAQLEITNNGLLVCRTGSSFHAPTGSVVNIDYGSICNSYDF